MKRAHALVLSAALAACSAGGSGPITGIGESPGGAKTAGGGYALTDEEKGLDCKRLTGRMKIRIIQIRDYHSRTKSSELSRSLQSAQSKFGGSATGSDPDGEYARDRAMLEAYNAQLASKSCATLDLAAELKQ